MSTTKWEVNHPQPLVMSIQRTVSSTSTLTNLSEDFANEDLEDVDNVNLATEDLVRKAKSYIESLSNFDVIVMETIKAAPILRAMIDHAPCDRGRRYAACVIISCDDNKPQLVNVANRAPLTIDMLLTPVTNSCY